MFSQESSPAPPPPARPAPPPCNYLPETRYRDSPRPPVRNRSAGGWGGGGRESRVRPSYPVSIKYYRDAVGIRVNNFAGEGGNGNKFFNGKQPVKKMDIDRHSPRLMPSNCQILNQPYFLLPATFKEQITRLQDPQDPFQLINY